MSSPVPSTVVLSNADAAALVIEELGAAACPDVRIVLSGTGYALRSGDRVLLDVEPATSAQMDILGRVGSARLFERRSDGSFLCVERVVVVGGDVHAV